jgi:His-Xaa-Ser system radical SAM maturase HxsB
MMFMPLRTRALANGHVLHVNDDGRFFASDGAFVDRALAGGLSTTDAAFLDARNHRIAEEDSFGLASFQYRQAQRLTNAGPLDYLILVPTLRCNLSCSYCQVSRAALDARGYDWNNETFGEVLKLIDELPSPRIKIEFQGGEPTLRSDLVQSVMERCSRFEERQFVICTNLHEIGPDQWALFDRPDVFISTSLDGDLLTHAKQRTGEETSKFETNLRAVIGRYGPAKVSALPTIDPDDPPDIASVIDTFASFGLTSIFLRPINYQGFARKRHAKSRDLNSDWEAYHRAFVRNLIARNWRDRTHVLEETYLSICLRRIFHPGTQRHVDLRNPNPLGVDYLVIDFDGRLYPTDEARMLSRSGVIDLSLGQIGEDYRGNTWESLNCHSTNQFDPACSRCAFQPYCGRDLVDDLARYGRIDLPRTETAFCQRHMGLFEFLFELIYDSDPAVRYSLARWLRLDAEDVELGEHLQ